MSTLPYMIPEAVTPRYISDEPKKFKVIDALIIIICLFLVFWFLRLFYNNLYQTLDSNAEEIGFVTMRINNIQRRQNDRVLWDRIRNESPVYSGDLIRVAENSGVNLHFDNNSVELDENTMIRAIKSADGQIRLELATGTLRLDTGEHGGNISILVDGKLIEAQAGTVLSVMSTEEEVVLNVLSVTEGFSVLIDEEGNPYDAEAGAVISFSKETIGVDTSNVAIADEELEEIEEIIEVIEEAKTSTEQIVIEVTLLPAPGLIQPVNGYRLGPSHLRTARNLNFVWSSVEGANAYIHTLYRQNVNGRRQLVRSDTLTSTNRNLTDLSILNTGRYIWQVEAVNRNSAGEIIRRGYLAERYFTVDIPVPEVELHETRNLYDR